MRDPKYDPQPGDVTNTYNDIIEAYVERTVIARQGCTVLFSIGEQMYSVCIDLWRMMHKLSS